MIAKQLSSSLSVSPQIRPEDVKAAQALGFRAIMVNRPDNEESAQPSIDEIRQAATDAGLGFMALPVVPGRITDTDVAQFQAAMHSLDKPVLAYCRTGMRAVTLWALSEASNQPSSAIVEKAAAAGFDLTPIRLQLDQRKRSPHGSASPRSYDVVIVGGGSAGIAAAASILKRSHRLKIAIIEPRDSHDYQPGFTMVGGGIFQQSVTRRPMASVMPRGVDWIKAAAKSFDAQASEVILDEGARVAYRALVLAPGLVLHWDAIPGLAQALGKNGVTSNYRYDLAPYTWELVQKLKAGKAIFTQPPMPIKCAGAPQKAMYLACDAWKRRGVLRNIQVSFHTSAPALFGVGAYIPALMSYIRGYGVDLALQSQLVSVDGEEKTATFSNRDADGNTTTVTQSFDLLHVTPPQKAPAFIAASPFANALGWADVDLATLQQVRYPNVFAVGDVISCANAKTAAAARKQAPIVAVNVLALLAGKPLPAHYDGYGSCPLTVERGKIVLAEFGYGGKLLPTFPKKILDGTKPSRLAWILKANLLPPVYWSAMLKGREWLAKTSVSA